MNVRVILRTEFNNSSDRLGADLSDNTAVGKRHVSPINVPGKGRCKLSDSAVIGVG